MAATEVKERGAATMNIKLSEGIITVTHGDSPSSVLAQWEANEGDWNRLWDTIHLLQSQGGGKR